MPNRHEHMPQEPGNEFRPAHIESKGKQHRKTRFEKGKDYPDRFLVPDDKVAWSVDYPEYQPAYYVAQSVLDNDSTKKPNGWADPENIFPGNKYYSYETNILTNEKGQPLNPKGRTGLSGRGLLGKWGANFAADPIITRFNPETNGLELLAIQRDNGEWAIPGGMVDADETISMTARREFLEETGVDLDLSDGQIVYRGYVDDPRNTDNAWMETTAVHKHVSSEIFKTMAPKAGDDARAVQWLELNPDNIASLYASHADLITRAVSNLYRNKLTEELDLPLKLALEKILQNSRN